MGRQTGADRHDFHGLQIILDLPMVATLIYPKPVQQEADLGGGFVQAVGRLPAGANLTAGNALVWET